MSASRRFLTKLLCASTVLLCGTTVALAQSQPYPSKPIKFLVGFATGGSIDAVARILAVHMKNKLGQPGVVENRTGASGMLAAAELLRSPADGYTVLFTNASMITVAPTLSKNVPYNVEKDLAPVSLVVSFPFILMINPENPRTASVSNFADFIALARRKPGELNYGSNGGPGNLAHLSFELVDKIAGTKMVNVPYKGAAASQLALLSKEVDATFDNPSVMPQIKAGKLKPLAVSTPNRWRDLPDVPTISELGYPGFDTSAWAGVFVHAQTPPAIVKLLADTIRSAADDPAMKALLLQHGDLHMLDPQQFAARIKTETRTYAEVIKEAKIPMQE